MVNNAQSKKNKSKKNIVVCGVAIALVLVIFVIVLFSNFQPTKNTKSTFRENDDVADVAMIPENLVIFNKCRILKMVDDYIKVKNNRTEREHFNTYDVIDDKTVSCLEERSNNAIEFVTNTNTMWDTRKDENFMNSIQTPEYFLKDLNEKCEKNIVIDDVRDSDLKDFALYYAYWGNLGNFNHDLRDFMTYAYARDLVFEAGATYTVNENGFTLSIVLPKSGKKIVVTQDTDQDSAPRPYDVPKWRSGWWKK